MSITNINSSNDEGTVNNGTGLPKFEQFGVNKSISNLISGLNDEQKKHIELIFDKYGKNTVPFELKHFKIGKALPDYNNPFSGGMYLIIDGIYKDTNSDDVFIICNANNNDYYNDNKDIRIIDLKKYLFDYPNN